MDMMVSPGKAPRVKSPCVNVCVMDEDSGYCLGCKRSLNEIAGWAMASDPERLAVLAVLPAREVPKYEDGLSWQSERA